METADKKFLREADEQETALKKSEKQARKKLDELKNALGIQTARKAALTDEKLKSEVALDMIVGEGKNDPQLEAVIIDLEDKIRLTERNIATLTRSIANRETELKLYPDQYAAIEKQRQLARLFEIVRRYNKAAALMADVYRDWQTNINGLHANMIDRHLFTSANRNGGIRTAIINPHDLPRVFVSGEDDPEVAPGPNNWSDPRFYYYRGGQTTMYSGQTFIGGTRAERGSLC